MMAGQEALSEAAAREADLTISNLTEMQVLLALDLAKY